MYYVKFIAFVFIVSLCLTTQTLIERNINATDDYMMQQAALAIIILPTCNFTYIPSKSSDCTNLSNSTLNITCCYLYGKTNGTANNNCFISFSNNTLATAAWFSNYVTVNGNSTGVTNNCDSKYLAVGSLISLVIFSFFV